MATIALVAAHDDVVVAADQTQLLFEEVADSFSQGTDALDHGVLSDSTVQVLGKTTRAERFESTLVVLLRQRGEYEYIRHEEKMTDVNIACHMLTDAMAGRFDVALLISGDSDLVPPVQNIRQHWPNKRVIAVFPPNRHSKALKDAVHGYVNINEYNLRQCLLPDVVRLQSGETAERPDHWR